MTDLAAAGGEEVRGPAHVCLRGRGPWGGCVRTAAAGLRSRIKRQGGAGRAFFCTYGGSPAASGGEGRLVPRGRGSPIRSGMTCEWDATRQGIPDQVGDDMRVGCHEAGDPRSGRG